MEKKKLNNLLQKNSKKIYHLIFRDIKKNSFLISIFYQVL